MAEKMGGWVPFGEGFRIVWEGVLERDFFRVSWGSGGAKMGCAGFELGGVMEEGMERGGGMGLTKSKGFCVYGRETISRFYEELRRNFFSLPDRRNSTGDFQVEVFPIVV